MRPLYYLLIIIFSLESQAKVLGLIQLDVINIQHRKDALYFSISIEAQLSLPRKIQRDKSTAKKFQAEWNKNLLQYLSLPSCRLIGSEWNKRRTLPTRMSGSFKVKCPHKKGVLPRKAYREEKTLSLSLKSTPTIDKVSLSIGVGHSVHYRAKNGRYVPQKIYTNKHEINL